MMLGFSLLMVMPEDFARCRSRTPGPLAGRPTRRPAPVAGAGFTSAGCFLYTWANSCARPLLPARMSCFLEFITVLSGRLDAAAFRTRRAALSLLRSEKRGEPSRGSVPIAMDARALRIGFQGERLRDPVEGPERRNTHRGGMQKCDR